jgi:ABC-type lipoprotein release transport system permease subunit
LLLIHAIAGKKLDLPGIMLTPVAASQAACIALGLALAASVVPALRIMRVDCAQALRRG